MPMNIPTMNANLSKLIDFVLRQQPRPVTPSYLAGEINRRYNRYMTAAQINQWASYDSRGIKAVGEELLARKHGRTAPKWWFDGMPIANDTAWRHGSIQISRTGDVIHDQHIQIAQDALSAIKTNRKRDGSLIQQVAGEISEMADLAQRSNHENRVQERLIEAYRIILRQQGIKPDEMLPSS
jgi:hypothetical protein